MSNFQYSANGLALTKSFEGCRLKAYQDSGGVWTVGYGATGPNVVEGTTWTQPQSDLELLADLADAVACVNHYVTEPINQHQFDALVDFTYNAGRGNFMESTLLKKVNEGDFLGAAAQLGLWVHAAGEVIAGLVRRRAAEAALFEAAI